MDKENTYKIINENFDYAVQKNQTFTKKQFIVHFIDERLNTKIADCEKKYLAFSH